MRAYHDLVNFNIVRGVLNFCGQGVAAISLQVGHFQNELLVLLVLHLPLHLQLGDLLLHLLDDLRLLLRRHDLDLALLKVVKKVKV